MLHPNYTINAVLRKDTANSEGLCQIAVVLTVKGKRKYNSTGLRVDPSNWKEDASKVVGLANSALYNKKITDAMTEVEAHYLSGTITGGEKDVDFLAYCDQVLERSGMAENTKRGWGIHIKTLRAYQPKIKFSDITPAWLNSYLLYRKETTIQNTAVKSLQFVRRMFNEALKDGTTTLYPFAKFKIPAEKVHAKQYLTLSELDKFEKLLKCDLSREMKTVLVHFLLECYSGVRFSDWNRWSVEVLDKTPALKLNTAKTDAPIYLPIGKGSRLEKVIRRIEKERLEWPGYTVQDTNRMLKLLAGVAGITKKVTTHVGRHSAATLLLEKGHTKETVAEVLGVTMKVVDVYAKMTRRKIRLAFEQIGGI